jgi:hypothetical protein
LYWRKTFREILPGGIISLNEPNFLFSAPSLDFLFARDRDANVPKRFPMNQPEDFVLGREPRDESVPVFQHPALDIVGYADVQVSSSACQDVNPICAAHSTTLERNSRSLTAVRQRRATGFGMTG